MKKSIFLVVAIFTTLLVFSCFQAVYAVDLNLIDSIRQNEITSAENLAIENSVANTTDTVDTTENTLYNTTLTTSDSNTISSDNDISTTYNSIDDIDYDTPIYDSYNYYDTSATSNTTSNTTSYQNTSSSTTTVTSNYNTSSSNMSLGNILSILLIVVGFVLILLGIAIIIRVKK